MKRNLQQQIAALEAKKARDNARLAAMKGKAKVIDRKRDTRRKILVGAAVLIEMEREPKFAAYVRKVLGKAVTRTQDRDAIADLLVSAAAEVTGPAPAPASNTNTRPDAPAAQAASAAPVTTEAHVSG